MQSSCLVSANIVPEHNATGAACCCSEPGPTTNTECDKHKDDKYTATISTSHYQALLAHKLAVADAMETQCSTYAMQQTATTTIIYRYALLL